LLDLNTLTLHRASCTVERDIGGGSTVFNCPGCLFLICRCCSTRRRWFGYRRAARSPARARSPPAHLRSPLRPRIGGRVRYSHGSPLLSSQDTPVSSLSVILALCGILLATSLPHHRHSTTYDGLTQLSSAIPGDIGTATSHLVGVCWGDVLLKISSHLPIAPSGGSCMKRSGRTLLRVSLMAFTLCSSSAWHRTAR
jgi:hypothetical protein